MSVKKLILCLAAVMVCSFAGCADRADKNPAPSPQKDIVLNDTDDSGENYTFEYDGKRFKARYTYDNWKIFDSYKIINEDDLVRICRVLADTHPVHGSDLSSYRKPEDMAYEWQQHNIAYAVLPKDDPLRDHAKDVDLDPEDQGRSFQEIYEDRTGRKLELW